MVTGRSDARATRFRRHTIDDSIRALDLQLSEAEMRELQEISELPVPYPMNFWNTFCYRESEFYGGLH